MALIFPNEYAAAISNLGFNAAFAAFEEYGFSCERFFYSNGEVRSLSGKRLRDFKVWAFSISFEMDVLNIFDIFAHEKVEILAEKRKGNPFVIFGGAMTFFNPNAFWHVADLILHGEIEGMGNVLENLRDTLKAQWSEILEKMVKFSDVSVPVIGKKAVNLAKLRNLSMSLGSSVFLSEEGVFGKTYLIEIERGCIHRCSFCVASKIYNIVRFMPLEEVKKRISEAIDYTDKVGLVASSVSDYPYLMDLLVWLKDKVKFLSVSSLRLDAISVELVKILESMGDREITFAPEAGTQKMRDLLNKEIDEEDIKRAIQNVKMAGLRRVKMYFIYGLPDEDQSDLNGIIDVVKMVKDEGIIPYVSLNPLIPKPFTNFENFQMRSSKDLKERERYLQSNLGRIGVKSKFESVRLSRIQWVLATANEEISYELARRNERLKFIQDIEREWQAEPVWKYIDISWKNAEFGELKILKEG
ncbi:hypothetical protein ATHSA_0569 [Athalassotoga saccharophila]|nr:hypothetical protein ATHSA_0569 [Athalassotoga saccharophila]